MKRLIQYSFAVLILLSFSSALRAQYIASDSGNGVVFQSYGVSDSVNVEGPPDAHYSNIAPGGAVVLDMCFRRTASGPLLPILPNSVLTVYGVKPKGVDSSAVSVQFIMFGMSGVQSYSSRYFYANPGVTTISVPDTEYNAVEFTPTGGGTSQGSGGFLLDAIMLRENFSNLKVGYTIIPSGSGLIANYPNPFSASGRTVMKMRVTQAGEGSLVLFDAVGREVERATLGHLEPGVYTHEFQASAPGVYFARFLLNGIPYGRTLKMTSIR